MTNRKKAYKDMDFLNSRAARPLRILSEFLEPQNRFTKENIHNAIVFYGSARINEENKYKVESGNQTGELSTMSKYYDEARQLAQRLTGWSKEKWPKENRFPIMTGGGPGIMRAANEGASRVQDSVNIGLNISLPYEQDSNPFVTPDLNFEFHYFFSRKFWFINMARVLIVFPGGFGTLDELFELLTLVQTKKVHKEVSICLYGKDFWDKLIDFEFLVENGLIDKEDLNLFHKTDNIDEAFEHITSFLKKLR